MNISFVMLNQRAVIRTHHLFLEEHPMHNIIEIECPPELLIGLHTNAEQFAERVKRAKLKGPCSDLILVPSRQRQLFPPPRRT